MAARHNYLTGARVYLSGPMDFVASRADERRIGWRSRIALFLKSLGAVVFDPWFKPGVRGLHQYGREGTELPPEREAWRFDSGPRAARVRAACSSTFCRTMHLDLRMVDVSDFVIAFCPTNIYSVGTPHEIVVARQQHKPVLMVSPPTSFPTLQELKDHLITAGDSLGHGLVEELERQAALRPNERGVPSLWYMALVGSENFFDGFGFNAYKRRFRWERSPLDDCEHRRAPQRPLLPFLEQLNKKLPKRWCEIRNRFVADEDWLLLDIESSAAKAARS